MERTDKTGHDSSILVSAPAGFRFGGWRHTAASEMAPAIGECCVHVSIKGVPGGRGIFLIPSMTCKNPVQE
jgi:hypothetical protein